MPRKGGDALDYPWAPGTAWRELLDQIPTIAYVRDTQAGTLVFVNDAVARFTGQSEAEILATGTGVFDAFVHPDDFASLGDISAAIPLSSDGRDIRARNREGEWRIIALREQELRTPFDNGRYVLGLATDVTERRRDAAAAVASEAFSRQVADAGPALVSVFDLAKRRFRFGNERWRKFYGVSEDAVETVGETLIRTRVAHEDRDRVSRLIEELEHSPVGTAIENEFRLRDAAGRWRCLHSWDTVFRAEEDDGSARAVLSTALDVTEARAREREVAENEARLQEIQKLESLGQITGGIAHDFNNLLTGILGYADLLASDAPPSSDTHHFASEITRAATRAADMCSRLLTYSGHRALSREPTELNGIVSEAEALLRAAVPKTARVTLALDTASLPIEADAVEIQQVALNLILNAVEALEGKRGEVSVRSGSREFTAEALRAGWGSDDPSPGRYAYLEVVDDGVGMDRATQVQIFEPFFSTKLSGRGLGLSVALRIVREHGGILTMDTEPGRGSRFLALFPTLEQGVGTGDSAERGGDLDALDAAILVVDDEVSVRSVARRILERAGCRVFEAPDGEAGLEAVRRFGGQLDVALVDLTLPGMHGSEVARAMQRMREELPIVLMSGFSAEGAIPYHRTFLRKPFDAASLVGTLRGCLRRAAGGRPARPAPPSPRADPAL